jgi:hypothetical protein
MRTPSTFFKTSRGLLNIALVKLIDDKTDASSIRFVSDTSREAYISLPRREGEGVLLRMANEMLIAE